MWIGELVFVQVERNEELNSRTISRLQFLVWCKDKLRKDTERDRSSIGSTESRKSNTEEDDIKEDCLQDKQTTDMPEPDMTPKVGCQATQSKDKNKNGVQMIRLDEFSNDR